MERGVRNQQQQRGGGGGGCRGGGVQSEPDFFLQWGNRKRLRCVKVLVKDEGTEKTTVRVDRRVVRADKDSLLLLRRPSPQALLIRNSENSTASPMKGQSNGSSSPERAEAARVSNGNGAGGSGSSETAHEKKGAGSSSGSDASVWPKFTVALSNKEKEEDFWAIKGSKLPQRPKKRSKFIQRTLNLVSPGTWLSDLTLERYEVREKKISKKRPRGLKAMGTMESDSE